MKFLFLFQAFGAFAFKRGTGRTGFHKPLSALLDKAQDSLSYAKRKLAVVISYDGSDYYGLQMDSGSPLRTIESELENALHKTGCILESNRKDLGKIQWSRSSRTDKGVHAACLCVSAKLEIDLSWIHRDQRLPLLKDRLNSILPSSIRVLSCTKVNQGFHARTACTWREYEYLVPARLLNSIGRSPMTEMEFSDMFDKLDTALQMFVGSHSFHNFHKLSPKDLRKRDWAKQNPIATSTIDVLGSPDISGPETLLFSDGFVSSISEKNTDKPISLDFDDTIISTVVEKTAEVHKNMSESSEYRTWSPRPRDVSEKTRGVIYLCETDGILKIGREDFVRIRIRGQSFLLHQIRLMIGAAVLVATGRIPSWFIDAALCIPFHVNFPMAPAEGLVLVDAGFTRNVNGQAFSMTPKSASGQDGELVLVGSDDLTMCEEFKNSNIYTRIADNWSRKNVNDSEDVGSNWIEYIDRKFKKHSEYQITLSGLLSKYRELQEQEDSEKCMKENARIRRFLADCRQVLFANSSTTGTENSGVLVSGKKANMFQHKKLLPNTVATELITRFKVVPSDRFVFEAMRALATEVLSGKLREDLSPREIVDHVESTGGLLAWAKKEKHPLIE